MKYTLVSPGYKYNLLLAGTAFSALFDWRFRLKKAYKQAMSKWEDDYECAQSPCGLKRSGDLWNLGSKKGFLPLCICF